MLKFNHIYLLTLALILTQGFASAQFLSGSLSGNIGPGDYQVIGSILVIPGNTLTIAPGTTFRFNGDYDFDIYGVVIAVGTEFDSIKFMQNAGYSAWNGTDLHNPETDDCVFEYCLFEGSNCKGLDFFASSPYFAHCTVRNNNSGGG